VPPSIPAVADAEKKPLAFGPTKKHSNTHVIPVASFRG